MAEESGRGFVKDAEIWDTGAVNEEAKVTEIASSFHQPLLCVRVGLSGHAQ
jgi:hypothetical protein